MDPTEVWKPVIDPVYVGSYQVSNFGRVKSLARTRAGIGGFPVAVKERILKPSISKNGYHSVVLAVNKENVTHSLHKLVIEAFKGKTPKGKEIRHKDGDNSNNSLENLVFSSHVSNIQDKNIHGTHLLGSKRGSILTPEQVREIRLLGRTIKGAVIARKYNVEKSTIYHILNLKSWDPRKYLKVIKKQIKFYIKIRNKSTVGHINFLMEELKTIDVDCVAYPQAKAEYRILHNGTDKASSSIRP